MAKNKKIDSNMDNIPVPGGVVVSGNLDDVSAYKDAPAQDPSEQSDSVSDESASTPAFEDAQTKAERLFAYNRDTEAEEAPAPAPQEQLTEVADKVADVEDRQPLPADAVVLEHLRVIDSYQPVSVPKFRDAAGLSQNAVFLLWEYERAGLVSRAYKNSIGVWSLTDAGRDRLR